MAGNMVARIERSYIPDMALDLTDDEPRALAMHLRCVLDDVPFWRLDPLKAVLAHRGTEPMPPYGTEHRAGKAMLKIYLATMLFICLFGFAATVVGCTPTTPQARACEPGTAPGTPWVPADYANGKWVPGHCLGQPAQ
jgi:hypothetical protein